MIYFFSYENNINHDASDQKIKTLCGRREEQSFDASEGHASKSDLHNMEKRLKSIEDKLDKCTSSRKRSDSVGFCDVVIYLFPLIIDQSPMSRRLGNEKMKNRSTIVLNNAAQC